MAISAISSVATYEAAKQPVERTAKAEPVKTNVDRAPVVETQPVPVTNGSETGNGTSEQGKDSEKNANRVKDAVNQANNRLKQKHASTKCEFSYHEATGRISIKVMDKETDEVIREIPPEETLEMVEKMWELAGIIVDEHR
ncbi:MAG: flagellar protein FlaG [Lachnospiraceae bacterium]|nr:flagellar protein FlaG [Lachnospiraceae bacterium]